MKKRKICVVTGTRAEYGLLFWLLKGLNNDKDIELQLCVTGMHLSPEFGLTYETIEKDGFQIHKKIEILLSSDTSVGINKSMGLGLIGFADCFAELNPDLLLVLGDRFEIFVTVVAAMISRIPIAHCHGGESTEGLIDESIRHSITKMSHLHFTSTEIYKRRVIQLGEYPKFVHNVGALGIENLNKLDLLTKKELELRMGFTFSKRNLLVTFHPVTLEHATSEIQFSALLSALDSFTEVKVIFTKPNADTDGRKIIQLIDDYVSKNKDRCISFVSLGQLRYLSLLKFVDGVVGNSSSGIIEAPSFKTGTINIGDRQKGRIKAKSVIDCEPDSHSIIDAINLLYSNTFQQSLKRVTNPYGTKNASELILPIIKNVDLSDILKKRFFDINS